MKAMCADGSQSRARSLPFRPSSLENPALNLPMHNPFATFREVNPLQNPPPQIAVSQLLSGFACVLSKRIGGFPLSIVDPRPLLH